LFERFTENAIKAIVLAQEESRRNGHRFVGTEQILIGLMLVPDKASLCLQSVGVKIHRLREEVETISGRGPGADPVEMPFTPRSQLMFKLAWDEALRLKDNDVTPGHLLLGLIRDGEGVGVRALKNLGVDLSSLKQTLEESMAKPSIRSEGVPSEKEVATRVALEDALKSVRRAKESAIRSQQFELAAELREYETGLADRVRQSERLHKD